MKHMILKRALAALTLSAVAACSGSLGSGAPVAPPVTPIATPASGVALVGVGDSLTAGYQSDGFLGVTTATYSLSAYPGNAVPPGQENGYWSLLYQQVTGASAASMYDASTSPLPLIKAPGMGTQIVLSASPPPFARVQNANSAFNEAGFSSTAWSSVRANPSGPVYDLGVPGITMHEALKMSGPLTGPPPATSSCSAPGGYPVLPGDPTAGGLQDVVSGESGVFYPVLGQFQANFSGSSLTMVNVAAAYKPKLATVWLGANDLLKYIFADGNSPVSDSPAQIGTDLTAIVKQLTASGAKVLVADLPTVLSTPQFFPDAKLTADFTAVLEALGIPAAGAPTYASQITAQLESAYKINNGGYLTESGFLDTVSAAVSAIQANPAAPAFSSIDLDACGSGTGAGGEYITPAFAQAINTYNTAINSAIDSVAKNSGTSVALVPINATFQEIGTNGVTLAPGETATLQFGGGLLSWDGLHPSNLGYAVIANAFIQAADTPTAGGGLGLSIPPLSNAQIGAIASSDPYDPFVIKALNPQSPFPLP